MRLQELPNHRQLFFFAETFGEKWRKGMDRAAKRKMKAPNTVDRWKIAKEEGAEKISSRKCLNLAKK